MSRRTCPRSVPPARRALGAGRVLLGSAIATPSELTLTGSLVRVSDGAELANGSVAGLPDSVAVLVNRLVARLLSQEAGESRERFDGLASTSLEALQDYLAARKAIAAATISRRWTCTGVPSPSIRISRRPPSAW